MRFNKNIAKVLLSSALAASMLSTAAMAANTGMNMFQNSDFIETEQPELNAETKQLISLYQRNPGMENYLNLRDMVIVNYNAVLDRKEAKLASLKEETAGKPGGDDIVAEMEEIVQDMYITYWNRINSSMLRFTDTRLLKWSISNASKYEYIPVMGAGETIYIKRTPVTNAEYAEYIAATGAKAPSNWTNGTYPKGEGELPVNLVSYKDAESYCKWLTAKDGVNTYRLPNESEWELAAGHMPKDAAFNCCVNDGRTPVEEYAGETRGAHGAVDFWGNVWEWTSTVRSSDNGTTMLGVKGGSWCSDRTDCRTEYRKEGRNMSVGYEDVGFRVLQVLGGSEPAQKVELATLSAPSVKAETTSSGMISLSWKAVDEAVEYQIFEYCVDTGLVRMLERTADTDFTVKANNDGKSYGYIVQPISYTAICDNVSAEYAVKPGEKQDTPEKPASPDTLAVSAAFNSQTNRVTVSWNAVDGADSYYVYKYNPTKKTLSKPRVVTGRTACSFKATAGATYCFIVSTEEITNRKGYESDSFVKIDVPKF
ncbi:MAG: SUMF1/EgtB/PvdO family nonheme iron enzyme [Oscillospiraceae bacterium]